jgi:hypothetical protein
MQLKCLSCDIDLLELETGIDVFMCPLENITWKLSEREDGRYLEKIYARRDYRGPTMAKVD